MQEDLSTQLKRALDEYPEIVQPKGSTLPAAVLILLYRQGDLWHILFTRRTQTVASHQGQVSFPGGHIEAHDKGPVEAALREAREEIGIRPMDVTLLGSLKPLLSGTNFMITPIVGIMPWPYPLHPNREEVARIFGVPLKWLADPANLDAKYSPESKDWLPASYSFNYQDEVIWGVTARIIFSLLDKLAISPLKKIKPYSAV
jgi:8-oxo-dGTP pyrophosphatase MutT (NUDIX family)